jgi:hypothetical protein
MTGLKSWTDPDVPDGPHFQTILSTQIQAGNLKLTSATVKDGEWYSESGVIIDATTGVSIYGGHIGYRTFATIGAYNTWKSLGNQDSLVGVQCYIGTDGKISAGAGTVYLDSTGLTIDTSTYTSNFKLTWNWITTNIYFDGTDVIFPSEIRCASLMPLYGYDSIGSYGDIWGSGYFSSLYGAYLTVNVSCNPDSPGGANLGSSSYYWGTSYIDNGRFVTSCSPTDNYGADLGNSYTIWNNLYCSNIVTYTVCRPDSDGGADLGSYMYWWFYGYISRLWVDTYIYPYTNWGVSLGSSIYRWKKMYGNPVLAGAYVAPAEPGELLYDGDLGTATLKVYSGGAFRSNT